MTEAQAAYEAAVETTEPSEQDALLGECHALQLRIAEVTGIGTVGLQEQQPASLVPATVKSEDGKTDEPALVIKLDRAALDVLALRDVLIAAGIVTPEAFDLAVLRAKRDVLASVVASVEATAANLKAQRASQLTTVERGGIVLPNGQPATTTRQQPNRATRRGHLTAVRH